LNSKEIKKLAELGLKTGGFLRNGNENLLIRPVEKREESY
jgi:uncharacterized protein YaaQ